MLAFENFRNCTQLENIKNVNVTIYGILSAYCAITCYRWDCLVKFITVCEPISLEIFYRLAENRKVKWRNLEAVRSLCSTPIPPKKSIVNNVSCWTEWDISFRIALIRSIRYHFFKTTMILIIYLWNCSLIFLEHTRYWPQRL